MGISHGGNNIKKYCEFLSKNKKNNIQFTNIGYYKPNQNLPKDNIVKRTFLIFVASFL